MIDWQEERKLFRACDEQAYFLSSAMGPLPDSVYQSYLDHTDRLRLNGDARWEETWAEIEEGRALAAKYLGASSSEVGFCSNTSFGMNHLAMMLAQDGLGEVLSCEEEFPSSTLPWKHQGFNVKLVPAKELPNHISENTKAVVVSAVQFSTGYRQDWYQLGSALAEKGIPFFLNFTQAIGAYPIDVKKAKVTALTASCHKWLCAGMGVSLLYLEPSFRKKYKQPMAGWFGVEDIGAMKNDELSLRDEASSVELGVMPFGTLLGVKKAFEQVERIEVHNISQRIQELSQVLHEGLQEIPNIEIISERDNEQNFENSINSGILLLKTENDPEAIVEKLMEKKIFISARRGFLRVAVHYFNNYEDIDRLLTELREMTSPS